MEIVSGHQTSRRIPLTEGVPLRVGCSEPSEVMLPQDALLEAVHFSLVFNGETCWLRVAASVSPIQIEGRAETSVELADASSWVAGQTWFSLRLIPHARANQISGFPAAVLTELRKNQTPLFALVDAARDEQVLTLLRNSDQQSQSLYEGLQGQLLSRQAPYLLRLMPDSATLARMLHQGWSKSWGVFLTSRLPFDEVRRHFRRFLFVLDEADREVYLRFYDPRVLRSLLPAFVASQAAAFFEGVESFLMEGASPRELLSFTWSGHELLQHAFELEGAGEGSPLA
ncbi:DUF4123 domain-containing protein [Hyalangium versicolor]|uniref:DUF4123 domain-containing protein n=1 Tax=Hyalangium versicolor TaxID=2861190 RepID=UPI001CCD782F|nr:DUF4123 domain-containing protein [Hyalangium versicolor]